MVFLLYLSNPPFTLIVHIIPPYYIPSALNTIPPIKQECCSLLWLQHPYLL